MERRARSERRILELWNRVDALADAFFFRSFQLAEVERQLTVGGDYARTANLAVVARVDTLEHREARAADARRGVVRALSDCISRVEAMEAEIAAMKADDAMKAEIAAMNACGQGSSAGGESGATACSSGGTQEPAVGSFPRAVGSERAEFLFQRELISSLQSVLREHHSDLASLHSNFHALKECVEGTDLPASEGSDHDDALLLLDVKAASSGLSEGAIERTRERISVLECATTASLEKFVTASSSSGEVTVTLTNKGGVRLAQEVATQTEQPALRSHLTSGSPAREGDSSRHDVARSEHDLRPGARVVLTDGPLAGRSGTVALVARSGGRVCACSVRVDGSTPDSPEWQLDALISEVEPLVEEPTVSSPAAPPRREASPLEPVEALAAAEAGERAAGQASGVADLESNSEVPLVYEPSPEPPQLNSREGTGKVGQPATFCAKADRWKDARGLFCKAPADVIPSVVPDDEPLLAGSYAPGSILLLKAAKARKERIGGIVEVAVVREANPYVFVSSPFLRGSSDRPRQFAKSLVVRTNRKVGDPVKPQNAAPLAEDVHDGSVAACGSCGRA